MCNFLLQLKSNRKLRLENIIFRVTNCALFGGNVPLFHLLSRFLDRPAFVPLFGNLSRLSRFQILIPKKKLVKFFFDDFQRNFLKIFLKMYESFWENVDVPIFFEKKMVTLIMTALRVPFMHMKKICEMCKKGNLSIYSEKVRCAFKKFCTNVYVCVCVVRMD